MISLVMFILQPDRGVGQIPDPGVRISVWFIGMFLLAVGWTLLYLRMAELKNERKSGNSEKN